MKCAELYFQRIRKKKLQNVCSNWNIQYQWKCYSFFNFGWYIEFTLYLNILFSQLWLILSILIDSSQCSKTIHIMLNFAWYGLASTLYKCRHVLFYANVSFILIELFFRCTQFPIHWIYLITVLYLFYFLNFTALLLFFIYA